MRRSFHFASSLMRQRWTSRQRFWLGGAATTTTLLAALHAGNEERSSTLSASFPTTLPSWMAQSISLLTSPLASTNTTMCLAKPRPPLYADEEDTGEETDDKIEKDESKPPSVLSREPRLANKVAVITGASRGLGQAIALQFIREGAKVILVDIAPHADETMQQIQNMLDQTAQQQHVTSISSPSSYPVLRAQDVALFVQADISDSKQVEKAIQRGVVKFGPRFDVLVNNACRFVFESVETASPQDWERSMSVNILGHALVTQACLPYMKHATSNSVQGYGPSIIFQGSISSFRGQPNCATYATMKGAIVQLARNCAYDFAKYNIRVNSLCAGTIETPISQEERKAHGWTFEEWEKLKTQDVFLQRVGTPYEIAKAAVFLASTDSSYTSGAHLMVDGGAAACTVMQR